MSTLLRKAVLFCLIFSLWSSKSFSQSDADIKTFNEYFSKVETTLLEETPFVTVKYLDISEKGRILITDRIQEAVFLYDSNGKLIKRLNPEESYPGINWSPDNAFFDGNGNIFVNNSAPWGLIFDSKGDLKRVLGKEYKRVTSMAFSDSSMYGYYSSYDGNYIMKMNSDGEEVTRFGDFPQEYETIIRHIKSGRGLVINADGEELFYTTLVSPKIYKYDLDGNKLNEFIRWPAYYEAVTLKNLKFKGPMQFAQKVIKHLDGKTLTYDIHELNKEIIIIQYNHNPVWGIDLVTTNGVYIFDQSILTDKKILAALNNKIYIKGDKENIILVYKFKP